MRQVYIADFKNHVGEEVTVKGWLYSKRSSGKLHFLQIRDGSGIAQAVLFKGDVDLELFQNCDHLSQESSLMVTGIVREDQRAPGGYELGLKDVKIVHKSEDYPISPKEHGIDFLLKHRHLWFRSKKAHATLKIRAWIIKAVRDFLDKEGFVLIDAPVFTPAACEGTTTLFPVEYFDDTAYLTQSGQLYMEAAAMAFGRVYCFGPVFRAEKSKTRRHLTEFWMVEPEMAYNDLDDVMECAEKMVAYTISIVLKNCEMELETLERDTSTLKKVKAPFPRISYDQALKILQEKGLAIKWGEDFGSPHETAIAESFDRPVFIHRFPASSKAFYMKQDPENDKLALGVDLLAPEGFGEIVGGGQREDSLERLQEKITEHKLPQDAFKWYLDLRKYGTVPHGGFGLGIERLVSWICSAKHVRETIPFPRMLDRIYP